MLDINYIKKHINKYILLSLFCFLFRTIYYIYSHEIYSLFITYSFILPILYGFILLIFFKYFNETILRLYDSSLITMVLYFILRGVLEIYGTTNILINFHLYIGIFLLVLSIFVIFFKCIKQKKIRFNLRKIIFILLLIFIMLFIISQMFLKIKNINSDNLIIIAHPDDEIIWGGANLLKEKYFVVCITCGSDLKREKEFISVMEEIKAEYIMLGFPDITDGRINNWKKHRKLIERNIKKIIKLKNWNNIVTHNPEGEYGHYHHIITSLLVTKNVSDKDKLYYFAKYYDKDLIEKKYNDCYKIDETLYNKKKKILNMYISQKKIIDELEHVLRYEKLVSYSEWIKIN